MERPRKRTRELISIIEQFDIEQKDKNRLKNVFGALNRIQGVYRLSARDNVLGLLSPFSRTSSATSSTTCEDVDPKYRLEPAGKTERGHRFAISGSCFTLLELRAKYTFMKRPSDLLQRLKLEEDPYSIILKAKGCECCVLDNCPISSGLCSALVEDEKGKFAICIMCSSHFASFNNQSPIDLPSGSHLYFFSDEMQSKLKS